jgi:hypothetical protein
MSKGFEGRCLCGGVHYRCDAEPTTGGHCQCVDCRKTSGTGHSSHILVPRAAVTIFGEVTLYERRADSGRMVTRAFCPRCGSPIYSLNAVMPDHMFLRASSLDDLERFTPHMVVYASRGASWDILDPALPRFEKLPPSMPL